MDEKDLIRCYRLTDRDLALLSENLHYEEGEADNKRFLIPNQQKQESMRERLAELENRISELETPSLKFTTLKEHFLDFAGYLHLQIEGLLTDPAAPFSELVWSYGDVFRKSRKTDDKNVCELSCILSQSEEIWNGIQEWIGSCRPDAIRSSIRFLQGMEEELLDYLKKADQLLPAASEENQKRLTELLKTSAVQYGHYCTELGRLLKQTSEKSGAETEKAAEVVEIPDTEKRVKLPVEEYRNILTYRYGVDLEEILAWRDPEVEKTRNECFAIAKDVAAFYNEPVPESMIEINDLLLRHAGPCDTPEEMLERANRYLRRTRALAHEMVDLPEDENCRCIPVPFRVRESYPWGGYEGGDSLVNPIRGQMFLNVYHHQNVTDGWIKINSLHEAYPGHHVQYVKCLTDPMPETVKLGAKSVALMEGMCLRTERAFAYIFGDDPCYLLFSAYRRHHTSVRIKVDLMLFYDGCTIEEAVQTYMQELGFDRISARGQVLSQEITPGYFTCYYYGMKKICDWEKEFQYDKRSFTQLLFSVGNISLANFRRILEMGEDERKSYLTDFGSLVKEERLEKEYRKLDKDLADFHYAITGTSKSDCPHLLMPTAEVRKEMEEKQKLLLDRALKLEAPDEVFSIWKDHFVDFAKAEVLKLNRYFTSPSGPIRSMSSRMEEIFRTDSREAAVIISEYLALAEELPLVMDAFFDRSEELGKAAFAGVKSACEDWKRIWDFDYAKVLEKAEELPGEEQKKLRSGMEKLYGYLDIWSAKADVLPGACCEDTAIPDEEKTFRFEEAYYRAILHDNLGVELDELLSWYESEMNKTREEVFSIARALPIPENDPKNMKAVNEILLKYAGPCETPEEMFRRGRAYLDRAQKAAREYVWMPSDEYCALEPVPETLKFSFPWGGYEGGDGRRRPVYGNFFLNNYNFTAVTDGWIKMQAIHESYPGHHVQYVRRVTDPLPQTAEIGVKYIPLIEGMAHRSERVFEFVYPEDPFYPLFVAYRRHHTSVRIKADLMLRYFGKLIKEIVKLYMDELGFDYQTARGQIKAQENMEGYFTCYYYGMKKLCDWEKQYGFDEKTYTELLFSAGNISLANFERFLKLPEADKLRYRTHFSSLYHKEESFQ